MSRKKENRFARILGGVLRYVLATVSISIVFYIVFALVFSTEEEKRLERENAMYARLYPVLKEKERLVGDVIEGLYQKDDTLYRRIFETAAPSADPISAADLIEGSDSLAESFYLSYSATKSERLRLMAGTVEDNFREIFRILEEKKEAVPPLSLPLKGMNYVQVGAGIGEKTHPVHKLQMAHDGLDLIAPQGSPVYAVADGTVSDVVLSRRGLGNVVTLDHGNGYQTRYALLGDTSVSRGKHVKRGQKVGTVGITTFTFAPHLHYEVLLDGEIQDPVNHLFASVTPDEYAKMLYMSVSTSQSLD